MKKRFTIIFGVVYSFLTLLYHLIVFVIAEKLDMVICSEISFWNTKGIIILALVLLSQTIKMVLLFCIKRRFGLIVSVSIFVSAFTNGGIVLYLSFVLLALSILIAFIKWIIDLFNKRWNVRPLINTAIPFFAVGVLSVFVFVISMYTTYEMTEIIPNNDNTYIIERTISYDVYNAPNSEFVELKKNITVNLGITYLSSKDEEKFEFKRTDLHSDFTPSNVRWIDNDTFVIDGVQYELTDYVE